MVITRVCMCVLMCVAEWHTHLPVSSFLASSLPLSSCFPVSPASPPPLAAPFAFRRRTASEAPPVHVPKRNASRVGTPQATGPTGCGSSPTTRVQLGPDRSTRPKSGPSHHSVGRNARSTNAATSGVVRCLCFSFLVFLVFVWWCAPGVVVLPPLHP